MKRFAFLMAFLFLSRLCFASPSNSVSIPNSFSPNTVISSSDVNSDFNEIQSKYNAHTHTDITSLGTVNVGTWQSTVIGTQYGGTGQDFSAVVSGSTIYFNGAGTMTTLAKDTNDTRYLSNTGDSHAPAWSRVNLTNGVTGTLPAGNGGTGVTTGLSGMFGAWVDKSASYGAQQATTDGFVVVAFAVTDTSNYVYDVDGYTDSNANPTTLRCNAYFYHLDTAKPGKGGFTMPVRKNDYWKVVLTTSGTGTVDSFTVYWIPASS